MVSPAKPDASPGLIRGMGLGSATALNMIDMIGVGPFITMPLVLSAMGGPQALLGWVVGALLAVCDGLGIGGVRIPHSPGSGGSYRYLSEIYGPKKWGRLISFLFIWQLSFSAPLSIASGLLDCRLRRLLLAQSRNRLWRTTPLSCSVGGSHFK